MTGEIIPTTVGKGQKFPETDLTLCQALLSLYNSISWTTYVVISKKMSLNNGSLLAQMVKNLPATQETSIQSLGQEDSLVKEMATYSRILAWRIS